ncbi:hypothetical protein [Pseudomonas antarctica]|uniref:hypothetical protein n=1 Tax=Pseudomonas antarctica TaxID=219572 RepID=UPI00387B160F
MSDSTQCHCEVSCTKSRECCDKHSGHCSEHGAEIQVHVHIHRHLHCCPSKTVCSVEQPAEKTDQKLDQKPDNPVKPIELPVIRFGFYGVAMGSPHYPELMVQVNAPSNYGVGGVYNKIRAVTTLDASKDIISSALTAAQLKATYDVLSVGLHGSPFTVAEAVRLKEYAALGGVVLLTCDGATTAGMTNVLQQFGHTGVLTKATAVAYSGVASATERLSSYFGDSSGVTLKGHSLLVVTSGQLPSGSRVLATSGSNLLFWTVGATEGRVVAMSHFSLTQFDVAGTEIDNGQERFLNNMMAYLFDKVLEKR